MAQITGAREWIDPITEKHMGWEGVDPTNPNNRIVDLDDRNRNRKRRGGRGAATQIAGESRRRVSSQGFGNIIEDFPEAQRNLLSSEKDLLEDKKVLRALGEPSIREHDLEVTDVYWKSEEAQSRMFHPEDPQNKFQNPVKFADVKTSIASGIRTIIDPETKEPAFIVKQNEKTGNPQIIDRRFYSHDDVASVQGFEFDPKKMDRKSLIKNLRTTVQDRAVNKLSRHLSVNLAKQFGKSAVKLIPSVGFFMDTGSAIQAFRQGRTKHGLMYAASALVGEVPWIGDLTSMAITGDISMDLAAAQSGLTRAEFNDLMSLELKKAFNK